MKLIIALVGAGFLAAIHFFRQRQGRKNLEALESGSMCFHCDSKDITRDFTGIRCNTCGQFSSNELIGAPGVSKEELKALTKPEHKDI